MKGGYTPVRRRIAETDRIILSIIKDAALIDDRKVVNTHALDKIEIYAARFEAQMKALIEELEKFDDRS